MIERIRRFALKL